MHGTEHRSQKRRTFRLSAPLWLVSQPQDHCLLARRLLSSNRNRIFVTAFRSPTTVACFQTPIPGSTLPACYFKSTPSVSSARSTIRSAAVPVRPGYGRFTASGPLPIPRSAPLAAPPASTPRWAFCRPLDQSVQQVLPPVSPPSDRARFPLAPRRLP
jgi:hypothetical protein